MAISKGTIALANGQVVEAFNINGVFTNKEPIPTLYMHKTEESTNYVFETDLVLDSILFFPDGGATFSTPTITIRIGDLLLDGLPSPSKDFTRGELFENPIYYLRDMGLPVQGGERYRLTTDIANVTIISYFKEVNLQVLPFTTS